MLEQELKFALPDRDAYQAALRVFGPGETRELVNHYFRGDAQGRLDRGEAMVRLRTAGGRAWLAYKSGLVREGALFRCREEEDEIAPPLAEAILEGAQDPLALPLPSARAAREALGASPLRVAGCSRTRRTAVRLPDGDLAEIDRSTFPGGAEDWEIEIETSDPAGSERALRRLLGPPGIVLRPQTKTKYRRFLEAAERLR
jgi:uncharacterized protein YjbK